MQRRGDAAAAQDALIAARAPIKRMVLLYLTVDTLRPLQERGLIELSEIAELLGEPAAAEKELEELVRAFGDSPYAQYARALLSFNHKNRPDDALARLQRLDPAALDPVLRGWVAEKIKQIEALR